MTTEETTVDSDATVDASTDANLDAENQDNGTETEKKFTQADMNALAAKESAKAESRGRRKAGEEHTAAIDAARDLAIQEYREEIGLTDEAIAGLPQQPEVERNLRAEKSLHGKSIKKVQTLESENQTLRDALQEIVARDAVFKQAAGVAADPNDVWLRLSSRMSVSPDGINPVLRDSSGTVIADTAAEVAEALPGEIEKILSASPHLAAPNGVEGSGSAPQRAAAPTVTATAPDRATPQGAMHYLRENKAAFQK